jgi:hypothetical protein
VIHRYWSGRAQPPNPWLHNLVWQVHGRAVPVVDWTDEQLPAEVVAWLDSHRLEVRPPDRLRHRANMVRWWLLRAHGGVWLDHDVVPLAPVLDLPRPWSAALSSSRVGCAIGLDAGDLFAETMLSAMPCVPGVGRSSLDVSGDRLLCTLAPGRMERVPLLFDGQGNINDPAAPLVHLWAHAGDGDHRT